VLAQRGVLVGEQNEPADAVTRRQHDDQRGEDTPDAPAVEVRNAEARCRESTHQDRRDEKAGDDEEDIDADISAWEPLRERVIRDDEEHSQRAQSVDIGAIGDVNTWPAGHMRFRPC